MKYIKIFTLLVTIPVVLAFTTAPAIVFSNSYWINDHYGITLEIRENRLGISVKESPGNIWRHYGRVYRNMYKDGRGSSIRFDSNRSLVWKSRRHSKVIGFVRVSGINKYDQRYEYGNNHGYPLTDKLDIEGKWSSRDGRYRVELDRTADGLRARRNANEPWYDYKKDPYDDNVYYDERGNEYHILNSKCTWIAGNGRVQLEFYR